MQNSWGMGCGGVPAHSRRYTETLAHSYLCLGRISFSLESEGASISQPRFIDDTRSREAPRVKGLRGLRGVC